MSEETMNMYVVSDELFTAVVAANSEKAALSLLGLADFDADELAIEKLDATPNVGKPTVMYLEELG